MIIEMLIYCYGLYIFFGDDLICYWIKEEEDEWYVKDLLVWMCKFLIDKGFWDDVKEEVYNVEVVKEIDDVIKEVES